ncbi:MAG: Rieske 2Fe-2S domain-containing protein [Acidobacteria bacterium]|nr:Rieske 2Fe-2S domain-containing protein [Acidobacteriota bacterium]
MQSFEQEQGDAGRTKRAGELVTVGRADEVPEGRTATVELENGAELALFHTEGSFYAVDNSCPHRGSPLAEGNLCGASIECDWHGWRFDLRTGACLTHASAPVETYEVVVEDGWIKIRV